MFESGTVTINVKWAGEVKGFTIGHKPTMTDFVYVPYVFKANNWTTILGFEGTTSGTYGP